ncbi:nitroreductase family protein [Helicobacter suis]|uniref:nitroreductase family protein n=1 Tax=Helicobacter suis TaxID=104628 RepID=UPI001F462FA9|nr:nitroreductase family protein [Helicobacter suis]
MGTLYHKLVAFIPPAKDEWDFCQRVLKDRLRNEQVLIEAYMKEQCYIAVGQMTLAATLMGVDSCIMGGI